MIVFYDQNISLIFLCERLPPRDSTLQYKRCVHFLNNFLCITSLDRVKAQKRGTTLFNVNSHEQRENSWTVKFKKKCCVEKSSNQGRIQDLIDGGGQDFLGTEKRAAGENFFDLKDSKRVKIND